MFSMVGMMVFIVWFKRSPPERGGYRMFDLFEWISLLNFWMFIKL